MEMSLSGKTIVITRDLNQAKSFVERLKNLGAKVLLFPIIKITGPDDPDLIRTYLTDISTFEWIIFTSANAVRYFFKFKNNGRNDMHKIKIACVGKKTAEVLKAYNLTSLLIPSTFTSEELLKAILKYDVRRKRILLPVSNLAGNELQEGLQTHGAFVERIEVYKNILHRNSQKEMIFQKIENKSVDCLTFYSPSAINSFADLIGEKGITLINTRKIPIAVIGSTTAKAARGKNLNPEIMPAKSDEDTFVEELERFFEVRE
jgi:uroporphyrinogen-III synthase